MYLKVDGGGAEGRVVGVVVRGMSKHRVCFNAGWAFFATFIDHPSSSRSVHLWGGEKEERRGGRGRKQKGGEGGIKGVRKEERREGGRGGREEKRGGGVCCRGFALFCCKEF